jgi:hypothetical protein
MKMSTYQKTASALSKLVLLSLLMFMAVPAAAQLYNADSIKREMNMEFEFDPGFWSISAPARGNYFWNWTDAEVSYYASNDSCSMDALMLIDPNKAGMVAHYVDSMKKYTDSLGIAGDKLFLPVPGEKGKRVIGLLILSGPVEKVGAMHSRAATGNYENRIYYIVNNRNLLQIVISAPAESWKHAECADPALMLIGKIKLLGEPDPREKGVAQYYNIDLGDSAPATTPPVKPATTAKPANQSAVNSDVRDSVIELRHTASRIKDAIDNCSEAEEALAEKVRDLLDDLDRQIDNLEDAVK